MTGVVDWVRRSLLHPVERDHRQSDADFRRRQQVTAVTTIIGATLLAWGINAPRGGTAFYVATFLLAATWTIGAFASGPLHVGHVAARAGHRRPGVEAVGIGLALAALFVVGAFIVREVPFLRDQVDKLLEHVRQGSGPLTVVVTVVNGIAEELFFRGALYAAVPGRHQVVITTAVYTLATLATGNVMLTFAAAVLGVVVGLQRRASGGVLAPILTHVTWSLAMLAILPALIGE